jgi:hypothetical protein
MKCINCGTDNHLPARTASSGECQRCQHQFVFEPETMPPTTKFTDFFFAQLLDDVSAKKTLFFTPRQLYYLLNKKLQSRQHPGSSTKNLIRYLGWGSLATLAVSFFCANFFQLPLDIIIPILLSLYALVIIGVVGHNSISRRLNRRDRQNNLITLKILAGGLLLIGLPISIVTQSYLGMVIAIALGIMTIWLSWRREGQQRNIASNGLINREQFEEWLSQWTKVNGEPVKILGKPPAESLLTTPVPKMMSQQCDRVVVCDRRAIAQLLISNRFHIENSCAVVTIDGYPESTFGATMEMLRRNSHFKVYALHDGSAQGVQLIHRLRQEANWFPNTTIPIIGVGIMPRQVINNLDISSCQSARAARAAQAMSASVRASLNPDELSWLDSGCYLDLESFSSQKIMQILQRAIQESRELGIVKNDDLVDIDESDADFYLLENFG